MNAEAIVTEITITPADATRLARLCGQLDDNIHLIEKQLGVQIHNHGNIFNIAGPSAKQVDTTCQLLQKLYDQTLADEEISAEQVHLLFKEISSETLTHPTPPLEPHDCLLKTPKKTIKARSPAQKRYLHNIHNHDINFGIGPAGTGKTYLAVAAAVSALQNDEVKHITLTRPAVEAGERLGFLPGDLASKVDPYLRPIYDALYEMLGYEQVHKLIERHVIELAPLAYMRGRTLSDSFVILDEAQNATPSQMKMFLTRIGFNSTAVINGDITQIDLPRGSQSGLRDALGILRHLDDIGFTFFHAEDVVRHPIVEKIVRAYQDFSESEDSANKQS